MSPDNHANLFQNNLAKMLPGPFMNKNVSMFQNKNVPRFQDVYVPRFKLENVSTYQNRNVSMFPDKIAGMFQNKNAKMSLGKFVKINVWIPGGVNNVPMVKHLILPLHLPLLQCLRKRVEFQDLENEKYQWILVRYLFTVVSILMILYFHKGILKQMEINIWILVIHTG